MEKDITKKMLNVIRENTDKIKEQYNKVKPLVIEKANNEKDNFLTRSKILMEEAETQKKKIERGKSRKP